LFNQIQSKELSIDPSLLNLIILNKADDRINVLPSANNPISVIAEGLEYQVS
jgi:hypothetical protein